jgi:LmbE family N-acetylglucosaminyl deacetylase
VIPLRLSPTAGAPLTVLCLGAHADDIEIGCGGTLLALLASRPQTVVHWVVFSGAPGPRELEARESAKRFLRDAGGRHVAVHGFRDGFFPDEHTGIKERFETLKAAVSPDVVFTHYGADRHQDHRVIAELTWNTFRDHLILEYEIPKYDGDLGRPNVYMPLDETVVGAKVTHLLEAFPSQRAKHWFTEDLFRGLLRVRGVEAGGAARYAEAFHTRKAVFAP